MPYKMGVSGDVTMPLPTKGAGVFLNWIFGGTTTVSAPSDSNSTQTHILASMLTKSATLQVNRETPDGTDGVFTFHGCKPTQAVIECAVEDYVKITAAVDGEDMDTSTGLASASYSTSFTIFSWVGAAVTIGGSSVEMKNYKCTIARPLATERRYLHGSDLKKEPVENGLAEITVEGEIEFANTTQYARYLSATASGALASVVFTATGPIAHAGATLPQLVITTPNLDFESFGPPALNGQEVITHTFTGKALYDGTNEPITLTYRCPDAAI
jgi:hypothetical protein